MPRCTLVRIWKKESCERTTGETSTHVDDVLLFFRHHQLFGIVQSTPDFHEQHRVVDGT
jgi:hypothetical protein